jgi:hypothetical protein
MGSIFVRPIKSDQSLRDFAIDIFRWLEISSFKEDWRGKGPEQEFVGSAVGIEIIIFETPCKFYMEGYKKPELEKYPFIISLCPQQTQQAADYLTQHAHILAWRLSHEGFRCFVPKDWTTVSSERDGMVYDF